MIEISTKISVGKGKVDIKAIILDPKKVTDSERFDLKLKNVSNILREEFEEELNVLKTNLEKAESEIKFLNTVCVRANSKIDTLEENAIDANNKINSIASALENALKQIITNELNFKTAIDGLKQEIEDLKPKQ